MLYENLSYNWSIQPNLMEQCRLSQAEMLQGIERLPSSSYYIILFGLLCLLFYFLVQPYLSSKINESLYNRIGILGMCLVFLGLWVLTLFVFNLGEEDIKSFTRFASVAILPLLLIFGYVLYRRFWK